MNNFPPIVIFKLVNVPSITLLSLNSFSLEVCIWLVFVLLSSSAWGRSVSPLWWTSGLTADEKMRILNNRKLDTLSSFRMSTF